MARISELHYSNAYAKSSGVSEFLEVSLRPSENPADFTVSFYQASGTAGIEIPLTDPGIQVSVDPDNGEVVYVISADNFPILLTDPNGGGSNNYEAYALTNTVTGQVIDFYDIGGGTQNILAQDGAAAGAVSENLPVLNGPQSTTTTLQFNQPDPDTLSYETVAPGDTGVACFAAGTLIDTPQGARPVSDIGPGDRVLTIDGGAQTVRWAGAQTVRGRGRFAPVRFAEGVFGAERAVFVSPQHRVLVSGWQAELHFGAEEVLVPAVALTGCPGVTRTPCDLVTYVHFLFDSHHLVTASGLVSESFLPGAEAMNGVSGAAAEELFALFPGLRHAPEVYGKAARPVRAVREAAVLACA
jgi:hypothetical protein